MSEKGTVYFAAAEKKSGGMIFVRWSRNGISWKNFLKTACCDRHPLYLGRTRTVSGYRHVMTIINSGKRTHVGIFVPKEADMAAVIAELRLTCGATTDVRKQTICEFLDACFDEPLKAIYVTFSEDYFFETED